MAYPDLYNITYSYTGFQQSQGDNSFPGTQLDADLNGLESGILGLSAFMQNVVRADGALNNGIVTYDSLSPALQTAGIAPATTWAPETKYKFNGSVIENGSLYRANDAHTSGSSFADDLAANHWTLIATLSAGPQGEAAAIAVGDVTTLPPGSPATVTNSGTVNEAVLDFGVPKGDPGSPGSDGSNGSAATIAVGSVTTLSPGVPATITNSGTSSAAVLNFGIPAGADGGGDFLTNALLACKLSDATSGSVALGSIFADSFKTTDMVDVAGATNLDVSTAGQLKNAFAYTADVTSAAQAIKSSVYAPEPGFSDAGHAFDNDGSTPWVSKGSDTSTPINNTAWIGQDFGGSPKHIRRFTIQQNFDVNYSVTSVRLGYSDNGTAWTDVGTYTVSFGATVLSFDVPASGPHRYWRLIANSTVVGVSWGVSEIQMMENVPGNLAVKSQILPAAFVPAQMAAVVRVIPTDALTLNTDIFVDVSRDGGSTWGTLALELAFLDGGVSVLQSDWLSVTGQPSGDDPRWRIRSANNKRLSITDVGLGYEP